MSRANRLLEIVLRVAEDVLAQKAKERVWKTNCSAQRTRANRRWKEKKKEKMVKRDCEKKQRRGELKKEGEKSPTEGGYDTRSRSGGAGDGGGMGPLEWR